MTSVIGISKRVVYVTLRLCSLLTLHGWRNINERNMHHITACKYTCVYVCVLFLFDPMVDLLYRGQKGCLHSMHGTLRKVLASPAQ